MAGIKPEEIPDNVWLKILGYLTNDDLLPWTTQTDEERQKFPLGNRLFHLCGDRDLWREVTWQGGNVKAIVLRKLIKFLGPHTTKIRLQGHNSKKKKLVIPESFLHSVQSRCKNLKVIEFIDCSLEFYSTPLKKLPASLERIHLQRIHWTNLPNKAVRGLQASPFFKLQNRLPKLKEIEVRPESDPWLGRLDINLLQSKFGTVF